MAWIMEFSFVIHLFDKLPSRIYREPGLACLGFGSLKVVKAHFTS